MKKPTACMISLQWSLYLLPPASLDVTVITSVIADAIHHWIAFSINITAALWPICDKTLDDSEVIIGRSWGYIYSSKCVTLQ